MNANEITFGIEIECYLPIASVDFMIGNYHRGAQIQALPRGWNAQSDGSLACGAPAGCRGVEIVSPILRGADGIRQIIKVCEWLRAKGAQVNANCGFHVHVRADHLNENQLIRLVRMVANHEIGLFATTGSKARERNFFCASLKSPRPQSLRLAQEFRDKDSGVQIPRGHDDRYVSLNLTNLGSGSKPTVEFRLFAGTTNAIKIISYVRLCVGFVEKAAAPGKRMPSWDWKDVAASCFSRNGQRGTGAAETCRLLYGLGWIRGKESGLYGAVGAEDATLPTLADCKKELARLAEKYDGAAS